VNARPSEQLFLFEAGGIILLTAAVFILDWLTPLGWTVWLLYLVPLAWVLQFPRLQHAYYYAAAVTVLILAGAFISPGADDRGSALFNRVLGSSVIFLFTWMMVNRKTAHSALSEAEAARKAAETAREAAVEARTHVEATLEGVLQRERQTTEEKVLAEAGRLRAEMKVLSSKLRLDGIIQSAMDAIITVDDEQLVVLFNRAAERMFEWKADDVLGRPLDRLIPERFRQAHAEHIRRFGQSGVTTRQMGALGTITGLRASGTEFPIEAAISQVSVDGKRYYTVILRDITERKAAAEELQRQHDFIDAVLETAAALVVVLDDHGRILRFNRACEQTTGYTSEESIGKAVWDFLLLPQETEGVKQVFERLKKGEFRKEHQNHWVAKDGRQRLITWTNTVISDADGHMDYVVATGIDVTDLQEIHEQLRRTERVAELGTLASGMAHEIGTPMNVILGRAEYLMERVKEEPIKRGLQTIVTQVERITRVMNQLLSFARRRTPERRALNLRTTIEDNLEIFQERLSRAQVKLETSFPAACPPVHADPDQMSQVLINLVMNAIHAMPQGGTLRVGVKAGEDTVMLAVSDTGQGMPQDVIAKIFDPFFTTKEFGKGTGLGLTVVKGIVDEHRGAITVESEPGRGTTFTINLPLHRARQN
jgi:PAS domain S-box-containing protein